MHGYLTVMTAFVLPDDRRSSAESTRLMNSGPASTDVVFCRNNTLATGCGAVGAPDTMAAK